MESLEQMIDSEFSQKTRSDILLKIFLGVVTGYAGSQTYITGKLSVICSIEEL